MVGIDSNVFLRVFINDGGPQHRMAVDLVRANGQVWIGKVVLVETVWVLRKLFKYTKDQVLTFVNTVLEADAFVLEDREVIEAALFAFATGGAGYADCVILESARRQGAVPVFTFDLDLAKVEGAALLKGRHR